MIFLVDAKLVLLQSSKDVDGGLKYDMRIIAHNVEYFDLTRDQKSLPDSPNRSLPPTPAAKEALSTFSPDRGLKDSLWYFDGNGIQCWMDVEDLINAASTSNDRELPRSVSVSTDFYPTSIVLNKGVLLGVDADLVQRRDMQFAYFRFSIRTHLFLPQILQRHIFHLDTSAALDLAHRYQSLPYFSHALEVLLHTVLDEEVDKPPDPKHAQLPAVLSFLSSFPDYLDILVQCTRKTEVRSWRTLFSHLPPPKDLFDASLAKGMLKTAGGYLLVLHTFEELDTSSESCVRLFQKAKEAGDWDLCKELARFLMALDESGDTLRAALERLDLVLPNKSSSTEESSSNDSVRLKTPRPNNAVVVRREESSGQEQTAAAAEANGRPSPDIQGDDDETSVGLGLGLGIQMEQQDGGSEGYFSQQSPNA